MKMIDFWVVRKGEDTQKVAPEIADAISEHPDNQKCMFCSDAHEIGGMIAFRWMPGASIYTARICVNCMKHSDEKLAEMAQEKVFPDRVAEIEEHMRRYMKPDGFCLECGKPANQHHPVGPITVTISTPDEDEPPHEFCEWRCFAKWAAEQAGSTFVSEQS